MIHGLSKEKIKRCTHHPQKANGDSYWTDESICKESFAHMFECQFDEIRYSEMQKYFPSALSVFEDMMKGLV